MRKLQFRRDGTVVNQHPYHCSGESPLMRLGTYSAQRGPHSIGGGNIRDAPAELLYEAACYCRERLVAFVRRDKNHKNRSSARYYLKWLEHIQAERERQGDLTNRIKALFPDYPERWVEVSPYTTDDVRSWRINVWGSIGMIFRVATFLSTPSRRAAALEEAINHWTGRTAVRIEPNTVEPASPEAPKRLFVTQGRAVPMPRRHWPDCATNHGGAECDMGPECGGASLRSMLCENGPGIVDVPARAGKIERWQRQAPLGWDPYGDDE
jgi:hypothetical protein